MRLCDLCGARADVDTVEVLVTDLCDGTGDSIGEPFEVCVDCRERVRQRLESCVAELAAGVDGRATKAGFVHPTISVDGP
ncbi:MAG: hypothetical protein K2R98_28385 [Gemmataceae bacterium]|nr:hypothetical protein [Gemmataceae bacterium]